ncbi:MAG: DnaJ domain-containing protein [Rhodospirillaceae bacterium]|mgnify:FL=1|jgi:DnaJ like chaperone protein|nr:DnaJ domain-containing protein [Rhodospirillaceae bacterium]MBT4487045.1 DnaJ domain-containing protein [Rhodospirillaceae bacterium]MBT5192116.1 DnaJ domain-containing protein [Rhodospirillaceae bacterium]MBT5896327.1 DnaJ domain-containing protein [Rhodospirillaceae bacterium]MBT6426253.1 DnaJ domain-containing protein [Rhodospirillaceae bacterium]
MSIWNRIVRGVGGALDGPLGALIGGLAEQAADTLRHIAGEPGEGDGTRQVAFTIGVIALGAKMAKADGHVTRDEVEAFKQVFKISPEDMKDVSRVFNLARKDVAGFEAYAGQIADLFEPASQVLEDLLHGLFHIAKADQILHPAELEYLGKVAEIFGFEAAGFSRIRAYHLGPDLADPYTILGIEADADEDAVKAVWRALIRENHPDRAIARGLPQEFVDLATEKLATINDAYDRISRQRGFK